MPKKIITVIIIIIIKTKKQIQKRLQVFTIQNTKNDKIT